MSDTPPRPLLWGYGAWLFLQAMALILVKSLFLGTIIWLLYPATIPAIIAAPASIPWRSSVAIVWVVALLKTI